MDDKLTLYQNRKTRDCLIERYVGTHAVGRLAPISGAEMEINGLERILGLLQDVSRPANGEKSERSSFSKEEDRAFNALHRGIGVDLSDDGSITVGPLRRKGSGYVVRKEETVRLSPRRTNEELLTALMACGFQIQKR